MRQLGVFGIGVVLYANANRTSARPCAGTLAGPTNSNSEFVPARGRRIRSSSENSVIAPAAIAALCTEAEHVLASYGIIASCVPAAHAGPKGYWNLSAGLPAAAIASVELTDRSSTTVEAK
jgi:hypothetical protein